MDSDDMFVVVPLFVIFLSSPILLVAGILSCIAWSNTRRWKKEKLQRLHASDDQNPLLTKPLAPQDEPEFLDSEDEAEYREQQAEEAEKEAEWSLTTGQKFRKELKKTWVGSANKAKVDEKAAKEERKKMAREIVREMMRYQKKQSGEKSGLSGYSKQA